MLESNSGASGLQIFIRCLHHLSSWSSLRKQRTIFDCRCGFPTLVAAWRYYREQCLWWQRGFKVTLGRTRTDSRKLKPRMFFFFCQNEEEGFHKVCEKTPRSHQIQTTVMGRMKYEADSMNENVITQITYIVRVCCCIRKERSKKNT